jgi:hypothetical protein
MVDTDMRRIGLEPIGEGYKSLKGKFQTVGGARIEVSFWKNKKCWLQAALVS